MWAQLLSALVGIWLMASPSILDYDDPARTNDWIVGPLAASLGIIAASKVNRSLRWTLLPLGLWQIVGPWVLGFATTPTINATLTGLILIACSQLGGQVATRYGGGWRALLPGRMPDET
jgi:hypothetical protein